MVVMVFVMTAAAAFMVVMVFVMTAAAAFMVVIVFVMTAAATTTAMVMGMLAVRLVASVISGLDHHFPFHSAGNLRQLLKEAVRIFRRQPQLLGGKGNGGLPDFRQSIELGFDLGCAVGAVQILDDIYFPFHMYLLKVLTYEQSFICIISVYSHSSPLSREKWESDYASIVSTSPSRVICSIWPSASRYASPQRVVLLSSISRYVPSTNT